MRSKTSFFNKTVFKNNTTRYWPIWVGYLALLLLIFPISRISYGRYGIYTDTTPFSFAEDLLIEAAGGGMIAILFIFAILSAMALYSYLYTTKSAGMIGSLPVTRRSMFFTSYMTGILWLVGADAVTAVFIMLAELALG